MRTVVATLSLGVILAFTGCSGSDGADGNDGTSCTVTDNGDGTATITCDDGTSVTIDDGTDGDSCTIVDNGDGTSTITCDDGTTVTISDGEDGASCTIVDNGNGTSTISCEDGTVVVVTDGEDGENGQNGGNTLITEHHGIDFLMSTGEYAEGKYFAVATITGATADANGVVTVEFTVETEDGDPVLGIPRVGANIAKLVGPETGEAFNKWVPYLYRTETVSGDTFPNPDGTEAFQGYRENNGTLTDNGDGSYEYEFATNISAITLGNDPITYERNLLHRVAVMMGGHSGATADAIYDFVPDGTTVTDTRDIVRTETCKGCHGPEFHGHGGDRLDVRVCATCHVPDVFDAQSGESLDLKDMIHKIHAGGELPSVAGPDGDPWATADNGEYAIWGHNNSKHTWWKVGFPAVIENCEKCHDGSGADSDNWMSVPSRDACQSCHDELDIESPGTTHGGGQQTSDASCAGCHPPTSGFVPIAVAHDWTVKDPRNVAEFVADITMSAPANGMYYEGDEAPVVTIVLNENGNPIADHRLLRGPAQGCIPSGDPPTCAPDADGLYRTTNFFVHGPRARSNPVLTTAARSDIVATTGGPFTWASNTSLTVYVDQGVDIIADDDWGTHLAGIVEVAVPAGTYTNAQLVALFNADADFATRALAYEENGRFALRSRNLGQVYSIQLGAGDVTTDVFGGDTSNHVPGGFYPSNTLASAATSVAGIPDPADDPKVTLYTDRIEYQLDPVTDLAPGTYVVGLELSQLGRVNSSNYRTPTVAKFRFEVKQATREDPIAGNCNSCHQSDGGKGFVLDFSRHNKIFDDTAPDQCTSCHDYQPQNPDCTISGNCGASVYSGWTGGRPISKRVHGIHFGSSLVHPLGTVDYGNGDPIAGRNWDITLPQDVRNCQVCHPDGDTSGTWATNPSRLPCSGCHDGDAQLTHMRLMTWDPTPDAPWSGDESESCKTCH